MTCGICILSPKKPHPCRNKLSLKSCAMLICSQEVLTALGLSVQVLAANDTHLRPRLCALRGVTARCDKLLGVRAGLPAGHAMTLSVHVQSAWVTEKVFKARPVSAEFFSERIDKMDAAMGGAIVTALKGASLLNATGFLIQDPRYWPDVIPGSAAYAIPVKLVCVCCHNLWQYSCDCIRSQKSRMITGFSKGTLVGCLNVMQASWLSVLVLCIFHWCVWHAICHKHVMHRRGSDTARICLYS